MKSTIDYLMTKMKLIEWELLNKPMDSQTRLKKVLALDYINDAINSLEKAELN